MRGTTAAFSSLVIAGILACGSGGTLPAGPTAPPPATAAKRLLVVTHTAGFRHDSIPADVWQEARFRQHLREAIRWAFDQ